MRSLYIECKSGISGDMAVAALLDLGADEEKLKQTLKELPIDDEFDIVISRVNKSGADACDFDVVLPDSVDNHDHDMEYLYGHLHEHEHHHGHEHTHDHEHEHHNHHHHGRGPVEIAEIFANSTMSERAKDVAMRILDVVTDAEAAAHEVPREQVHFHEVGAIDSIIDIASFAICYDDIYDRYNLSGAFISDLAEGFGTVRCQHGILEVPVPAVREIEKATKITLDRVNVQGELVTPTGAAIAAVMKEEGRDLDSFEIIQTGYGAGKRIYDTAGYVKAMIVDDSEIFEHGHYHSPEVKKKELARISKAIGHLQHVKSMIESDEDCSDVLIQLAAVRSAINSLGKEIINEHVSHCITHAIEDGDTKALDDFKDAIKKFV